ncbi:MAG: hypothetical protein M1368_06825 [Thaumarchaeota archaeon]|nr:hypothetical protein [Nitrososphaerota archaeon]
MLDSNSMEEQSKLLLSYYINQVPAHATYIVTGLFAILSTIVVIMLSVSSRPLSSGLETVFVLFGLFAFGISLYSYGRLLYYNESIYILYSNLGITNKPTQSYYLDLFMIASREMKDGSLSNLVRSEVFYRIDENGKRKRGIVTCVKYRLLAIVFYRQRHSNNWDEEGKILKKTHKSLNNSKKYPDFNL